MKVVTSMILFLILTSFGNIKENAIQGRWNVKEVTYMKAGKKFGEEFTHGYYFLFTKEAFETSNSLGTYQGHWNKTGETLSMTTDGRTQHLGIVYHSRDSLVLSVHTKKEVLRFSLKKEKK